MGKIQQLPEDVAVKIAAGEVVERPASVVKELIENAIDADAHHISVIIVDGGKTKIEIKDDGGGMDRADAEKAFLRHGTSKIQSIDDLWRIGTLGFRGEALATIGASASVRLVTTERNASEGTEVLVEQGVMKTIRSHAPLVGTTITVEYLFSGLPARQKFLKSDATEWKAILDVIIRHMIAHPEVAFYVTHNDRTVYDMPPNQSMSDRTAIIWEVNAASLLAVDSEIPHYALHGLVLAPSAVHSRQFAGKGKQFLAVNGHPVSDKVVAKSVRDAYGSLLPPGFYPSFALNLVVHPGIVDVNIHPRKDEVRFVNSQEVFRFVMQSVSQALSKSNLSFTPEVARSPIVNSGLRQSSSPSPFLSSPAQMSTFRSRQSSFVAIPTPPASFASEWRETGAETIGVLVYDSTYLIATYDGSLLIVDQHAAHERILYHGIEEQQNATQSPCQSLLLPLSLDLSPEMQAHLDAHMESFVMLGFGFDEDGALTNVPVVIGQKDPLTFFRTLLVSIDDDRPDLDHNDFKHRIMATMACKAAVKAGDYLSPDEQQQLIRDLMGLPDRYTCPHGRPSYITVTTHDLEKLFKRSGF